MDDKNSSNVQHPLHAVLMIFHATVRTAFKTAAAFWRPWFREPEKKDVAARQHSKAASEEAPQPTKREQEATEKKPKAPIKRAQRPKTLTQEATMEKKPRAPTKRSLKDEQELQREDRSQKTLKGKLAFHGGGTLIVLGFGLFTAISFYPPEQDAITWLFWATLAGGFALFIAGGFIRNRGRLLLQPTASEVQAQDTRRPIMLLRSFPDDALTVVTGQSKDKLETGDFEESIADQFAPFGPFVAIGKPGEALPTLGAARNYYSDTEWQDAVGKWMDEALIIVVIAGVTAGLRWELDTIRNSGHLDKLLVLMPPMTLEDGQHVYRWSGGWTSKAQESKEGETRWDTLRSAFAGIDAFDQLPEDRPSGLIAMHLGQDGKLVLLIGPETAWEQDYERAIRYALYGMYIHGPRTALPRVPSKIQTGMGIEASL